MTTNPAGPPSRLIGVGVGPGDPDLITVRAVRLLQGADLILVPATEKSGDGPGRAEAIVAAACPGVADAIRRVPFSMADRSGVTERRLEAWQESAKAALDGFAAGARTVCLATVGDPSVYSTFSYLAAEVRRALPDVVVEVVPGITAMQALAAASVTPLVEGSEILALAPVTGDLTRLDAVLDAVDTVVFYKAGRQLPRLRTLLAEHRPDDVQVIGTDIGLPDESVDALADLPAGQKAPYFSAVLTGPRRTTTGGSL